MSSFVYFASPVEGGPIKIGCSKEPKDRLTNLMAMVPYPLELLAFAPGTMNDERKLHNVFIASHLRSEWFKPSVEMWALIGRIRETGVLPDEMRGSDNQRDELRRKNNAQSVRATPEWRAKVSATQKANWAKRKATVEFHKRLVKFMADNGLTAADINNHPSFVGARWKPIHAIQDGGFYVSGDHHGALEAIMAEYGQKVAA